MGLAPHQEQQTPAVFHLFLAPNRPEWIDTLLGGGEISLVPENLVRPQDLCFTLVGEPRERLKLSVLLIQQDGHSE